jgi:hypothetical protein
LPDSSYERIAKRYSCGGLQRAAYLERTVPTTAITASIGAALGVAEAFKLVRKMKRGQTKNDNTASQTPTTQLPTRIFMDSDLPNAQRVTLSVNPDCPVCSEQGSVPFVAEPSQFDSAKHNADRVITTQVHSSELPSHLQHWLNGLVSNNQQNGEAPLEDAPVVFSDAIITKARCKHCPPHKTLNALVGRRAKSVTDSVMVCQECHGETVQLEFLEMCSISELINKSIALGPGQPAWLSCGQHYFDHIPYSKDNYE